MKRWLLDLHSPQVQALQNACKAVEILASPNLYLSMDGKPYDASLLINDVGEIVCISKMVHIAQAEHFYEQNYYTSAEDGFQVVKTPFGQVGIVI